MNDLIRPSLYNAYHHIVPVVRNKKRAKSFVMWSARYANQEIFLQGRENSDRVKQGEYLAVMSAGAYGFSMSSNYNSRPRAAEVMVKGKEHVLIRKRETYDDLIRNEQIPAFLR